MKYFTLITFFLISFQASGQKISKSDLIGCWTDSSEENIQGSNEYIYRPCDYKIFPSARFRFKMNLKGGSVCSYLVLSPDDGHYMTNGSWSFNEETNQLKIYDGDIEIFKCIIESVEHNLLKIKN